MSIEELSQLKELFRQLWALPFAGSAVIEITVPAENEDIESLVGSWGTTKLGSIRLPLNSRKHRFSENGVAQLKGEGSWSCLPHELFSRTENAFTRAGIVVVSMMRSRLEAYRPNTCGAASGWWVAFLADRQQVVAGEGEEFRREHIIHSPFDLSIQAIDWIIEENHVETFGCYAWELDAPVGRDNVAQSSPESSKAVNEPPPRPKGGRKLDPRVTQRANFAKSWRLKNPGWPAWSKMTADYKVEFPNDSVGPDDLRLAFKRRPDDKTTETT